MKPRKTLIALEYVGVLALVIAAGIVVKPKVDETLEGIEAARTIQQMIEEPSQPRGLVLGN